MGLKSQEWPRQTKPKKGQFMDFSHGHSGTKVRYVNRACFPKEKTTEFTQKWAKVLALSLVWFAGATPDESQERKIGQKRKGLIFSLWTSGQKLRSGSPILEKQAFWHGHPARTSMRKLPSEKFWAASLSLQTYLTLHRNLCMFVPVRGSQKRAWGREFVRVCFCLLGFLVQV